MFVFFAVHFLLFAYLFFRLVLPLRSSRIAKSALAVLLFVISQHYLIRMAFDSMATPGVPSALIAVEGWASLTLLFMVLLTALRDIFLVLRRLFAKRRSAAGGASRAFSPERRLLLMAGAGAVPAAFAVGKAVAVPAVRPVEARFADLPAGLDGFRIIQITDLHASDLLRRDWVRSVVDAVNAQEPDLVLFTGDTADGSVAQRTEDVAPLAGLRARFGVFGCTGNHEYYGGFSPWMAAFERLGMTMLLNGHALFSVNGADLVVGGVTDEVAGGFGLPMPDAVAAFHGAPVDAFRIMLDHRPGGAAKNAAAGAQLQLSGHTHGGHILGMDQLVARANNGFVRGWYVVNGMRLYVSSGAGLWNGFPARLGVPSELPLVVLRRG
ncbi:metallophosphoesterase [Desulfovibrio sp. OttesenSCG-928-I05]|nr:metallophosphoesterase [Desulfovibrio sp. OttesenSCG-928-I05]